MNPKNKNRDGFSWLFQCQLIIDPYNLNNQLMRIKNDLNKQLLLFIYLGSSSSHFNLVEWKSFL